LTNLVNLLKGNYKGKQTHLSFSTSPQIILINL